MDHNDDSTMNITHNSSYDASNFSSLVGGATVGLAEPESLSNNNGTGSEIKDGNDGGVEAEDESTTEERQLETRSVVGSWSKSKRPEEALMEIVTQDTHDLYCNKCKSQITKTALLFEKGREPPPYKENTFVLWIPVVIPFKLPPISLRRDPPVPLVVITPPTPTPTPGPPDVIHPHPIPPIGAPVPPPNTEIPPVPDLRFLLVLVLLLLSVIVMWFMQPLKDKDDPADIIKNSTRIDTGGGLNSLPWSWIISFPAISFLPLLMLLFLPILPLRLPSIRFPIICGSFSFLITDPQLLAHFLREHIVVPVRNRLSAKPDILKSIVYGGLVESITSLGVVSSAAASGASTLNVLALSLANLSSGLFLIIHNLYGLVMSRPRLQGANNDHMPNVGDEDPYQKLLGRSENYKRHCIVVVLSFLFFGVIPPLYYGLSFQKNDKGYYKAAVVLAASLACVIFLSFAKACAFHMPKRLKTVAEYTGMAIGASALSFITSQIVADLFERYGLHELATDSRSF